MAALGGGGLFLMSEVPLYMLHVRLTSRGPREALRGLSGACPCSRQFVLGAILWVYIVKNRQYLQKLTFDQPKGWGPVSYEWGTYVYVAYWPEIEPHIAGRDRAIIAAYDDHLAPLHPDLHVLGAILWVFIVKS